MKETKVMIYGAGGCGINIVHSKDWNVKDDNAAETHTSFIDTSKSNIKETMGKEQVYILPNLDGSGKKRDENHLEISNVIKDILVRHKPLDFNIVVFSLSGGSGSVLGPLIVSELLGRNIPVLAICVGSDESILTANNTLKSLKSLDAIAKLNKKSLTMIYQHNEKGVPRGSVDTTIHGYIAGLLYLFSGKNDELDSQDLTNWLDFTRTTKLGPQVGLLETYSHADHVMENHPNPVSVSSLYTNKNVHGLTVVPDYHCAGYADLTEAKVDQLHFVIDVQKVPVIARRIEDTLHGQKEVSDSRPAQGSLVSSRDTVEDSGLVL